MRDSFITASATYLAQNVWKGLNTIPDVVYLIASLIFLFSEKARGISKQTAEYIIQQTKELIEAIKKFIDYITSILKELLEILKPAGTAVVLLISNMILSIDIMEAEIEEIEGLRVKS